MEVHVNPELEKRLTHLATTTGRAKVALVQHAFAEYVDARARGREALDWSGCPAVESVSGKVSGAWVLGGTRMPVATIFENIEAGANIDDIIEWYDGLDREQVKAVIDFAVRSLETSAHGR